MLISVMLQCSELHGDKQTEKNHRAWSQRSPGISRRFFKELLAGQGNRFVEHAQAIDARGESADVLRGAQNGFVLSFKIPALAKHAIRQDATYNLQRLNSVHDDGDRA